jgi:hypothetical protein
MRVSVEDKPSTTGRSVNERNVTSGKTPLVILCQVSQYIHLVVIVSPLLDLLHKEVLIHDTC